MNISGKYYNHWDTIAALGFEVQATPPLSISPVLEL